MSETAWQKRTRRERERDAFVAEHGNRCELCGNEPKSRDPRAPRKDGGPVTVPALTLKTRSSHRTALPVTNRGSSGDRVATPSVRQRGEARIAQERAVLSAEAGYSSGDPGGSAQAGPPLRR